MWRGAVAVRRACPCRCPGRPYATRTPGPWGFTHSGARPAPTPPRESVPKTPSEPVRPSSAEWDWTPSPSSAPASPSPSASPSAPLKWPPVLLAVCAGVGVLVLYAGLMMREATLEEVADDLRWGGRLDVLHALSVLTRWLSFERLGVGTSHALPRPVPAPLLDDVLGALSSRHEDVRRAALRVLCLCSPSLPPLRDPSVVPLLRRSVCEGDMYALTLLGSLAMHAPVARAIASDRALVRRLLVQTATSMARGLVEDRVVVRACMRLWSALVLREDVRPLLGASHERALKHLCTHSALPLDTRTWPAFTALSLALHAEPNQWTAMIAASGQSLGSPERLLYDEAVTQAGLGGLIVALTALALTRYSQWRQWRVKSPSLYELRNARSALVRAPVVAVALWGSLKAVTMASAALSERMAQHDPRLPSWSDTNTRAPLVAASPLLVAIPLCIAAFRLAPTALLPALLPWPLYSPVPPLYISLSHMWRAQQQRWFLRGANVNPVDLTPAELEAVLPESRLWE